MNPKQFYDTFVNPALESWKLNQTDIRLAIIAICELDNLVEHCIVHGLGVGSTRKMVADAREQVAQAHPFLGLARDAHDTHKHGNLARRTARITQAQQPQSASFGGGIGGGVGAPIGGAIAYLVIETDDGQRHPLSSVILQCDEYLLGELCKIGP